MLREFMIAVMCLLTCALEAQTFRRNGFKLDLHDVGRQRYGLSYERRQNERSGFEVQIGYMHHNTTSQSFFNGTYQLDYALRLVNVFLPEQGVFQGWEEYFGTGRPLPELPVNPVQLSTITAGFAYRSSYGKNPHLRFFLQPSMQIMRHRYAETSDYTKVLHKDIETWYAGSQIPDGTVSRQTTYFRQTREMRIHNRWYGGVAYDLGLACTLKNGLHLEASGGLGLNVGKTAYEKPKMPFTLNSVYPRYALRAGYFLGKMRETPPLNG